VVVKRSSQIIITLVMTTVNKILSYAYQLGLEMHVPPTYPEGCKVVAVGEAPGKEEEEKVAGFVGKAGQTLDKVLFVSGLHRSNIGVTNVSKRPPDGGYDSEHFKLTFYETVRPETKTHKVLKRCGCGKTKKQHESKNKKIDCPEFKALIVEKN
jgi:hypothetical protein